VYELSVVGVVVLILLVCGRNRHTIFYVPLLIAPYEYVVGLHFLRDVTESSVRDGTEL